MTEHKAVMVARQKWVYSALVDIHPECGYRVSSGRTDNVWGTVLSVLKKLFSRLTTELSKWVRRSPTIRLIGE